MKQILFSTKQKPIIFNVILENPLLLQTRFYTNRFAFFLQIDFVDWKFQSKNN